MSGYERSSEPDVCNRMIAAAEQFLFNSGTAGWEKKEGYYVATVELDPSATRFSSQIISSIEARFKQIGITNPLAAMRDDATLFVQVSEHDYHQLHPPHDSLQEILGRKINQTGPINRIIAPAEQHNRGKEDPNRGRE